jgi:site-specific DNA-cytosine methylase
MDRNRLKAIGNAVTPGCSEIVGYAIQQLIEEQGL